MESWVLPQRCRGWRSQTRTVTTEIQHVNPPGEFRIIRLAMSEKYEKSAWRATVIYVKHRTPPAR